MISILLALAFIGLVIGSYTDIKTREVPDWVNYFLISSALGLRLILSVIFWDYAYIVEGIAGFAIFAGLAYAMFYAGQWGGGDAKMLMGLGALIGFELSIYSLLLAFLVNAAVAGGIYGLLWSIWLAFSHRKRFRREFGKVFASKAMVTSRRILLLVSASLLFVIIGWEFPYEIGFFVLMLMSLLTPYLLVFVKAVENSSMFRYVEPERLTEGDWIVNDIKVAGKRICGPKDLGISKKQIAELVRLKKEGKVRKILIKEGIPFVPSFLIAFIISIVWGNLFLLLL